MTKFFVTLKSLREAGACYEGYNRVVRMLQGREFTVEDLKFDMYIPYAKGFATEISLIDICNNNGLDDALWALRCVKGVNRDARMFAVWCARQVEHLMEDQRSKDALLTVERYANGQAAEEEMRTAMAAARAAVWGSATAAANNAAMAAACGTSWDTAMAAACSASRSTATAAANNAVNNADMSASWDEARAAARSTSWDADMSAAWDAVWDAARDTARAAAVGAQKEMFIRMCNGEAPWHAEG